MIVFLSFSLFFIYKNKLVIYLFPLSSKFTVFVLLLPQWDWDSGNCISQTSLPAAFLPILPTGSSRGGWEAGGGKKWLPSCLLPIMSMLPRTGHLSHQQQLARTSVPASSSTPRTSCVSPSEEPTAAGWHPVLLDLSPLSSSHPVMANPCGYCLQISTSESPLAVFALHGLWRANF